MIIRTSCKFVTSTIEWKAPTTWTGRRQWRRLYHRYSIGKQDIIQSPSIAAISPHFLNFISPAATTSTHPNAQSNAPHPRLGVILISNNHQRELRSAESSWRFRSFVAFDPSPDNRLSWRLVQSPLAHLRDKPGKCRFKHNPSAGKTSPFTHPPPPLTDHPAVFELQ